MPGCGRHQTHETKDEEVNVDNTLARVLQLVFTAPAHRADFQMTEPRRHLSPVSVTSYAASSDLCSRLLVRPSRAAYQLNAFCYITPP